MFQDMDVKIRITEARFGPNPAGGML